MSNNSESIHILQSSLELPCGAVLKNRIAKSPMSDSLADGGGDPTEAQIRLYERWAEGGVALSFIGEVQGDPLLSPLFNHRSDGYGGSIEARCRIVLEVINNVRRAVGPSFPVGIRINSTDQLNGST